jgi:hypothetical protein
MDDKALAALVEKAKVVSGPKPESDDEGGEARRRRR